MAFGQGLAEGDAHVLDGVVIVHVQVAIGADGQVDHGVARDLVEHVVEESDAGGDVRGAGAVEVDGHLDPGLGGLPGDLGAAHGVHPFVSAAVGEDRLERAMRFELTTLTLAR